MQRDALILKTKTVLFAEDDAVMREHTAETLRILFDKVLLAKNGEEALALYEKEHADFVLTDIKMPQMDGLTLIKKIRERDYGIPVILLTGFAEQSMILSASNLSIDAYLVKPIELDSLVQSFLKASKRISNKTARIKINSSLDYDAKTKELFKDGKLVVLGYKEHELISLLLQNQDKTISKDEIVEKLWENDSTCESALKNLVLRIRKKVGFELIVSVRSIGYRIQMGD
jgi:DNA-binding response OmpR family regulator